LISEKEALIVEKIHLFFEGELKAAHFQFRRRKA
jgi:hypothetical protein